MSHGLLKTICDAIKSIHVNDANASRRANPQVTWKDYSIGNRVSQSLIDQIKSNLFNVQQVCGCNTVYIKTYECTCVSVRSNNPNSKYGPYSTHAFLLCVDDYFNSPNGIPELDAIYGLSGYYSGPHWFTFHSLDRLKVCENFCHIHYPWYIYENTYGWV